ncbi:MAG: DUF192 domain-containing protein [Bacteroidota bacterium]
MLRYVALLLATVVLIGCEPSASSSPAPPPADPDVSIPFREDGTLSFLRESDTLTTIAIEIADTDSSRERGMMQRTSFPPSSGMLFVFPNVAPRSFWMANTPLPLDIMFVDEDLTIVNIIKYTRPFSQASVSSEGPAQYVVEVPAGFSDQHGLIATDRVRWIDTR